MSDNTPLSMKLTIKVVNGEPLIDATALSLLFGVGEELVTALSARDTTNGYTTFPPEWIRNGRRRAREAFAHTKSNDMVSSLTYWARKDRGAELQLVYEDEQ
ncbi:hypothetical protein [Mycobacterium sp. M23085]|uniref:hypothetical protein n=1 Tax=Mycobacterium sp. M23085 TaxID=3378087 RepID=UPI0038784344